MVVENPPMEIGTKNLDLRPTFYVSSCIFMKKVLRLNFQDLETTKPIYRSWMEIRVVDSVLKMGTEILGLGSTKCYL